MIKFLKQKNMGRKTLSSAKGYTLVETLVAISIFTLSILALMSVLASGISNTNYAKQKIIASYLAEEGIEFMRNVRDDYMLYDNSWVNFKTAINKCGTPGTPKNCYFDDQILDFSNPNMPITDNLIKSCGSGVNDPCPNLLFNSNTGKYNYVSGADLGFARTIQAVYPGDSSDDIKILSTVSWKQGSGNYSITFSENLFNWVE